MFFFRNLKGKVRGALIYGAFIGLLGMIMSVMMQLPAASAEVKPVDAAAWEELAQCESHGDWKINTGNGFSGGLQFAQSSWTGFGGTEFAPTAHQAPKEAQMYVANKILEKQGWNAWPDCSNKLGLAQKYKYNPDFPKPGENSRSTSGNDSNAANVPGDDAGDSADNNATSGNNTSGSTNNTGGANGSNNNSGSGDGNSNNSDANSGGSNNNSTDDEGSSDSEGNSGDDALSDNKDSSSGSNSEEDANQGIVDPYGAAKLRAPASGEVLDPTFASPAQYAVNAKHMGNLSDAIHFLGFHRYKDAYTLPDSGESNINGSVIFDRASLWISSMLFSVSFAIGDLIGNLLVFVINTDIVGRGLYFADLVFARLATNLAFGTDDGAVTMVSKIMFYVFIAILISWGYQIMRPSKISVKTMFAPFLGAVAAIFAVALLGTQAAKNHASLNNNASELSTIGRETEGDGDKHFMDNSEAAKESGKYAREPQNWATMSPGWIIAWVNLGAKQLGGVASDLTNSLFNAVTYAVNPDSNNYTECDLYMQGMYAVFMNTEAAKGITDGSGMLPKGAPGSILMSYDRMYMSTIHKMWEEAGFGSSYGAGGAWCRMAESYAKVAPAEQAMISRVAGLYSEVVGTGGLFMVTPSKEDRPTEGAVVFHLATDPSRNGRAFTPSSGTLVKADGNWNADGKEGDPGQTVDEAGMDSDTARAVIEGQKNQWIPADAAANFFGPTYRNLAGLAQAKFYFAGCDFRDQGKPTRLRAEWKGVTRAMVPQPLVPEDCSGTITNGESVNGGFGQRMHSLDPSTTSLVTATAWNYSSHRDDNDAEKKKFDQNVKAAENGTESKSTGLFGWLARKTMSVIPFAEDANFKVKSMLTDSSSEIMKKFRGAERTGTEPYDPNLDRPTRAGNAPTEYFKAVNGMNNSNAAYAVMSVIIVFLLGKSFAPILLGAIVSQAVVIVFLMISVLLILFAFIPKVMQGLKTSVATVVSAMLVVSIIQVMLDLVFNFGKFFTVLINIDSLGYGLIRALAVGLSYIVAFKLVVMVASKLVAIDMSSMKGAMQAGIAAGAPALQGLDAKIASPLGGDFWKFRRADKQRMNDMGNRARKLNEYAKTAIDRDNKKRRTMDEDKKARNQGKRAIPERIRDDEKKSSLAKLIKSGAKKNAADALTSNPVGRGALKTGVLVGSGAKKAYRVGEKGVKLGNKTKRAVDATVASAKSSLNLDGVNGSNGRSPMSGRLTSNAIPGTVRGYRGTEHSSGGNLVDSAVRNTLSGHPFRAMKEGKLTSLANSVLGFEPDINDSMLDRHGAPRFDQDNYVDVVQRTPGAMSAPLSDAMDLSEVDVSRLDETRRARQVAFEANRTIGSGKDVFNESQFNVLLDQASGVVGAAGVDRETFIGDHGLPANQYSTMLDNFNSPKQIKGMEKAGIIDAHTRDIMVDAIKKGVDLNDYDYAGKADELSRALAKFHSERNIAAFEDMGFLTNDSKKVLQNAVDNGIDLLNHDYSEDSDVKRALQDVVNKASQNYTNSVNELSLREQAGDVFKRGGYREDYAEAIETTITKKFGNAVHEMEVKRDAAAIDYEKNKAEVREGFVDVKNRILNAANNFSKTFRSRYNSEGGKNSGIGGDSSGADV